MKSRALVLATLLLAGAAPGRVVALAPSAACPTTPAKLVHPPQLTLPPDAKITAKAVAFEVDLGSDGHVRGLQMDESSGDGAVDLSVRQTLQDAAYEPPQTGCVAYSGGLLLTFGLPAPSPGPSPIAAPTQAKLDTNCTPYVTAFLTPAARDRKRTGTAIVAVELDAAGTRTAAPVLKKSTGSAVLDAEAIRIAQTGQYNFLRGSACRPQAFTYNLELTLQ